MANALFVDALLGYKYYVDERGKASLSKINEYLSKADRREISLRTYTHYNNLYKNGFTSYIPINKFDVFRALGKVYAASDRRAFPRQKVNLNGQISRNAQTWEEIKLHNISPIGLGGQTVERFPVRPASPIWIKVEGYSTIPATVVWRRHRKNTTLLGFRTLQYLHKYRIRSGIKRKEGVTGTITIIRNVEGEIDWKGMFVVFDKLQQILDALEEFVLTVEELSDTSIPVSPTILRSINFGSPGNGVFGVDINLAEILKSVYLYVVDRKLFKRKLVAGVRAKN